MLKSRLHFHFPVLGRGRIYSFTKAAHHCCNLRLINNRITITTYVTTFFLMCGTTKKLERDFDVFYLVFWVLREGNWGRNGLLFHLSVVTVPEVFAKVKSAKFPARIFTKPPIMHLFSLKTFCTTIVFYFSWDDRNTQEKLESFNAYAKFWGVSKVHYCPCENGEWEKWK